ncbi:glycerol-3-phosphate dehydrogenase/oxidase [Desulfatitalea alkaliphila]|uniref:Glycerol-3-phosphate dehydrogenase n=1 Tax=Desulfatitalea alkaliphila TaxID=2929485 RepID=A0AA41ULX0_9BACT|nr:glycerol-3-phosphate dehydrogenase/oxidase [Desulfatitalea alkaliphila]MCJ8502842.1 glycerol-3-phosphate dehydrogenase/oxidase [Desulfatitalea alkaliphila]
MNRSEMMSRVAARTSPWDMLVIGGGATGVGIAVDAAARGYDILLLEQNDFGKGTSSRSTKLIHGGVRYLQQGNVALVMDALKERGCLRANAPHLVHDMAFVVPNYDWWEAPFYGIGLKVYDLLAGRYGFGPSKRLSKQETLERIPNIRQEGLRGGIIYHDGQFDDARLLINLARTAAHQGATVINYAPVTRLIKDDQGYVEGATFTDAETGEVHHVRAKVVINATGPFADDVRHMDDAQAQAMIAPSQGIHLVFDGSFLPGKSAIMVPHTKDGRVMFAIPYLGATLVGTTDTPITQCDLEPRPMAPEIDFILETAGTYLEKVPTRKDIRSMFAGIRPLVKAAEDAPTATLSRDHTIHISRSGMITIAGGKWTTYRQMAEECIDHALALTDLPLRSCATKSLNIHGYHKTPEKFGPLALYGADAPALNDLLDADPARRERLHPRMPTLAGEVLWAVRFEAARTVDDFLARRTRSLLLDARAAWEMAPGVAAVMAKELGRDAAWRDRQVAAFQQLAATYLPEGSD